MRRHGQHLWYLLALAGAAAASAAPPEGVAGRGVGVGADVAPKDGLVQARPGLLNLRTGDVEVAGLAPFVPGGKDEVGAPRHAVVVLDGPMTPARRAVLEATGARICGYLPTNAFLCEMSGADLAAVRASKFVLAVAAYRNEWKVDPALLRPEPVREWYSPQRAALAARGRAAACVWLFRGEDGAKAMARLSALPGVEVHDLDWCDGAYGVVLSMPRGGFGVLAGDASVQYVEPLPEYRPRSNSTTRWVVQSNTQGVHPFYVRGLIGTGQVIGIIDGGLGTSHCSFLDSQNEIGPLHRKILANNMNPHFYDQHGTHVSATAAGDAGVDANTRGVAYGARIVFNFYPDLSEASHTARYTLHRAQGAHVHNNSWGLDGVTDYDGGSRAIDAFHHAPGTQAAPQDDVLIVHAVSNSSTVGNPENAKNSLAVSASRNSPQQEDFCPILSGPGVGPTADGRRKPEVMAPGCFIASSSGASGCSTTTLSGTSMAAPAVAGLATLMREYFTRGFYPDGSANPADAFIPSGALLKAMIINGAQDMQGVAGYPNNREGWGRVLGDASAYFAGDARRLVIRDVRNASAAALTTGAEQEHEFLITSGSQPLRFTLVWSDAPAEVNATFTPVNNLDLVVVSPTGEAYAGNNFASGFSVTGGGPDALNNTEQVHIASPADGVWRVRVIGTAVQMGTQGYALVVTGGVEERPCPVDFDGSGGLDDLDITHFFSSFEEGDPRADLDGSGGLDDLDITEFFRLFEAGC